MTQNCGDDREDSDLFPDIRQRRPRNAWELRETWSYVWEAEQTCWKLTLDSGFEFEPSVPRPLWSLVSPMETLTASAPHDFIYRYEGQIPMTGADGRLDVKENGQWTAFEGTVSRRNADRFFGRILKEQGVTPWRRWMAFKAVHWFGRFWWG